MTWGLVWSILTNPWRFLKALFPHADRGIVPRQRPVAGVTPESLNHDVDALITRATREILDARPSSEAGSAYLDLSSACTELDKLGPSASYDVRTGRIPQACLGALRLRARRRLRAVGLAVAILGLEMASRALVYFDSSSENDSSPVTLGSYLLARLFAVGVPVVTACVVAALSIFWTQLQWDLRTQSLRKEEGLLMRKWTMDYDASENSREKGDVTHLVRIDNKKRLHNRNHEIASARLFDRLVVGDRYRMFLTRRAGLLVAIESVEIVNITAGYRNGAGKRHARVP